MGPNLRGMPHLFYESPAMDSYLKRKGQISDHFQSTVGLKITRYEGNSEEIRRGSN